MANTSLLVSYTSNSNLAFSWFECCAKMWCGGVIYPFCRSYKKTQMLHFKIVIIVHNVVMRIDITVKTILIKGLILKDNFYYLNL